MAAARNGHEESVLTLLDGGAYAAAQGARGETALALAARGGHADVVAALLECAGGGACAVDAVDDDGLTALAHAKARQRDAEARAGADAAARRAAWDSGMATRRLLVRAGASDFEAELHGAATLVQAHYRGRRGRRRAAAVRAGRAEAETAAFLGGVAALEAEDAAQAAAAREAAAQEADFLQSIGALQADFAREQEAAAQEAAELAFAEEVCGAAAGLIQAAWRRAGARARFRAHYRRVALERSSALDAERAADAGGGAGGATETTTVAPPTGGDGRKDGAPRLVCVVQFWAPESAAASSRASTPNSVRSGASELELQAVMDELKDPVKARSATRKSTPPRGQRRPRPSPASAASAAASDGGAEAGGGVEEKKVGAAFVLAAAAFADAGQEAHRGTWALADPAALRARGWHPRCPGPAFALWAHAGDGGGAMPKRLHHFATWARGVRKGLRKDGGGGAAAAGEPSDTRYTAECLFGPLRAALVRAAEAGRLGAFDPSKFSSGGGGGGGRMLLAVPRAAAQPDAFAAWMNAAWTQPPPEGAAKRGRKRFMFCGSSLLMYSPRAWAAVWRAEEQPRRATPPRGRGARGGAPRAAAAAAAAAAASAAADDAGAR